MGYMSGMWDRLYTNTDATSDGYLKRGVSGILTQLNSSLKLPLSLKYQLMITYNKHQ